MQWTNDKVIPYICALLRFHVGRVISLGFDKSYLGQDESIGNRIPVATVGLTLSRMVGAVE